MISIEPVYAVLIIIGMLSCGALVGFSSFEKIYSQIKEPTDALIKAQDDRIRSLEDLNDANRKLIRHQDVGIEKLEKQVEFYKETSSVV